MLMLLSPEAWAADKSQYSWLVGKTADMPSSKIMKMADNYARQGKDGEAIVLYTIIYNRYDDGMTDEAKNECALARQKAGKVYYERSNYINALNEFINGVKTSEQCRRPVYASSLYNYIGNVYCIFLDYEKGIDYYLKAYKLCGKYPNRETEHDITVNLTGMYTYLNDMKNAKKYYRLSEKNKNTDDPTDVYMSGYTLSLIQISEGNITQGINRLKQLAGYAVEKKIDPKYQCFAYQEIYEAYRQTGKSDSTLKYMYLCDATARKYNLQHSFAMTLKNLSEFYESKNDVAMSNKYKSLYLDIMDSIYNTRGFDMAKNSLFTYEVDKTTREMAALHQRDVERRQTIRQQRMMIGGVGSMMIVTVLFLVIVWRQKRKLDRSYTDLYKVNRNFVDSQKQLTDRLRESGETLKIKEQRITELEKQLGQDSADNAAAQKCSPKYHTSSLTDEQSRAIADAIMNIMENTTEFCDCNFSLGTLAELVGSNSKYVSQVINDTFHKSFNDYINPYRIHLACKRFTDTKNYGNLTMKAIGESVGFKSYTSFVNIFRKVTGISPSLYRKMAIQGEADR